MIGLAFFPFFFPFMPLLFLCLIAYVIYLLVNNDHRAPVGVACNRCHAVAPPNANFCMRCGAMLRSVTNGVPCSGCGYLNPADAAFCRQCGAQVQVKAS